MSDQGNTRVSCNPGCMRTCTKGGQTLIIGRNANTGERLRPASTDQGWHLRLASLLSVGERMPRFKCMVPGHESDGTPNLRVAECLRAKNADTFWQVMNFAMTNSLVVTQP